MVQTIHVMETQCPHRKKLCLFFPPFLLVVLVLLCRKCENNPQHLNQKMIFPLYVTEVP